jgi:hypothetical protein
MELSTGVEYEYYENATSYQVLEDNTVELYERTSQNKRRTIGHVHKDRWDGILLTEDAEST